MRQKDSQRNPGVRDTRRVPHTQVSTLGLNIPVISLTTGWPRRERELFCPQPTSLESEGFLLTWLLGNRKWIHLEVMNSYHIHRDQSGPPAGCVSLAQLLFPILLVTSPPSSFKISTF